MESDDDFIDEGLDEPERTEFLETEIFIQAIAELIGHLKIHNGAQLNPVVMKGLMEAAMLHGKEFGKFVATGLGKPILIDDDSGRILVVAYKDLESLISEDN